VEKKQGTELVQIPRRNCTFGNQRVMSVISHTLRTEHSNKNWSNFPLKF